MPHATVRRAVLTVGAAGLICAGLLGSAHASQPSATPAPSCGVPYESWGSAATVDDVEIKLLAVETVGADGSGSPVASPTPLQPTFRVQIELINLGSDAVSIVVSDISLILCSGDEVAAETIVDRDSMTDQEIAAGASVTGWVDFVSPTGATPTRLVVPVYRPGFNGSRVEFPLTDLSATPGSAPSGAGGADAFGGDATGGDGADGQDAVGSDATGGDGADGADATPVEDESPST